MNPSAIQSAQLNRLAIVYVRQSTPLQVEHHPESRLRQYQLTDRARAFGWPTQRCLVIDDDLGISGAQSSNRPGYQRLVSMLALREVGVVFGLEVSRLARNCLDWYQLLEFKVVRAEVVWQGGARSELDVPKYIGASTEAYHRAFELAKTHTDAEIAEELNAHGFLTMKQKPWSARRVMDFRVSNAIPSGLTASPTMRLPETDYISSSEAAERLGVDQSRIQTWFRWGVLSGKQDAVQRQLWIRWNEDVERRLCGTSPIDGSMVSVKRLCAQERKPAGEILIWAQTYGHEILRIRRGTSFRFYIVPGEADPEHRLSGQEALVH